MKAKLLISLIFIISSVSLMKSQEIKEVQSFWKANYFDFTLLTAGYEVRMATQLTFSIEGGGGLGLYLTNDKTSSALVSSIKSNVNYYYNFRKRVRKNKNTKYNSANFLTIGTEMRPSVSYLKGNDYGIYKNQIFYSAWGLRRNIGGNFTLQTELGLGVMHEYRRKYDIWGSTIVINAQLSYNF